MEFQQTILENHFENLEKKLLIQVLFESEYAPAVCTTFVVLLAQGDRGISEMVSPNNWSKSYRLKKKNKTCLSML